MEGSTSIPPEVSAYCEEVVSTLTTWLGSNLVGVYLHGSFTAGGWEPSRSDVDLLAVASRPLSSSEKWDIGRALLALPSPGVGLEFSLVTDADARLVRSRPPFELHVNGMDGRIEDGAGLHDVDLLAHFAMTRALGVAVVGLPPSEVFGEPPKESLLEALAADLAWGLQNAAYAYAVSNACRCLMYAREGRLGSKTEGAEWAMATGEVPDGLVDVALRLQRGGPLTHPDAETAEEFVQSVRRELLALAGKDDEA